MRRWLGALAGVAALGWAAFAAPAEAADRGVVVLASGDLGQPDASVVLLDLGTVARAGDTVTASMAMVVLDPQQARVPGVSYMVGHQRLSCRDRTTQTLHVEVYSIAGARMTEFDGEDPAEPVTSGSPWASLLDRACRNATLAEPGVQPFADIATGVAAVRASVDAAKAVVAPYAPHRYVLAGVVQDRTAGVSPAFVDMAQLERDGDSIVRWVLLTHANPRTDDVAPVAYDLLQVSFDCTGRRAQVRVGLSVGQDGAVLRSSIELGAWVTAAPDSMQSMQMNVACAATAQSDATFDSVEGAMGYARRLLAGGSAPPASGLQAS